MNGSNLKIAVLIDGDNASQKVIGESFEQIAAIGEIVIKRVYGDWSRPCLFRWKEYVNKHSIKAVQSFAYVKGKNSTDIALCIDAMDLMYANQANCFCIVSSDCDFTALVHRLKDNKIYTIGLGKESACNSFITACDSFLFEKKANNENITEKKSQVIGHSVNEENFLPMSVPKINGPKVLRKIEL